jgi:hypothetical protein
MTHYTKLKSYAIFIVVPFENVHLYVNENDVILKMFSLNVFKCYYEYCV